MRRCCQTCDVLQLLHGQDLGLVDPLELLDDAESRGITVGHFEREGERKASGICVNAVDESQSRLIGIGCTVISFQPCKQHSEQHKTRKEILAKHVIGDLFCLFLSIL